MVNKPMDGGGSIWNSDFRLDGALALSVQDAADSPAASFIRGIPDIGKTLTTVAEAADESLRTGGGMAKMLNSVTGITGMVDFIFKQITGNSIFDYLAKPITGNWTDLYGAADTWVRIAAAAGQTGEHVSALETATFTTSWTGVAATQSSIWTSDMAASLLELAEDAGLVGAQLANLAKVADEAAEAIGGAISLIIDVCIGAAASYAATPVVGALGTAAAGATVWAKVNKILSIIDGVIVAWNSVQALMAYASYRGQR